MIKIKIQSFQNQALGMEKRKPQGCLLSCILKDLEEKKGVQPITLTTPLSTFLFSCGGATSSLSPLAADPSITFVSHGGDESISSLSFLFSRGGFQPHHSHLSRLCPLTSFILEALHV
jgi:hypothetical protein